MSAAQSQVVCNDAHCGDAKRDVLFQRNAQFFSTFAHIVAIYAARERFILQLAFYGVGLDLKDALARLDQRAGGEKSSQLIARKKCVLKRSLAGHVAIIGM